MKLDLRHKRVLRTFAGLVLGAVVTAQLAEPCLYLSSNGGWELVLPAYSVERLFSSGFSMSMAVTFAVPLGLIAHALLYAQKRHALWHYLAAAGVAGLGLGPLLGPQLMTPVIWLFCIACGVLCGLITWLIRRPDKDVPLVCPVPSA